MSWHPQVVGFPKYPHDDLWLVHLTIELPSYPQIWIGWLYSYTAQKVTFPLKKWCLEEYFPFGMVPLLGAKCWTSGVNFVGLLSVRRFGEYEETISMLQKQCQRLSMLFRGGFSYFCGGFPYSQTTTKQGWGYNCLSCDEIHPKKWDFILGSFPEKKQFLSFPHSHSAESHVWRRVVCRHAATKRTNDHKHYRSLTDENREPEQFGFMPTSKKASEPQKKPSRILSMKPCVVSRSCFKSQRLVHVVSGGRFPKSQATIKQGWGYNRLSCDEIHPEKWDSFWGSFPENKKPFLSAKNKLC